MITAQEEAFIRIFLEGFFYGLYSGIFTVYLQCVTKKFRGQIIIFSALCLLYFLSAVNFLSDLVAVIRSSQAFSTILFQIESDLIMPRLKIIVAISSGCCDFIAQSIIIYRCWIVWDRNILIVIIPAFLAIAYIATWLQLLAPGIGFKFVQWEIPVFLTSFIASMAVNALVTGLIVFRILKAYLEVTKATSVERTLGSTAAAARRGTELRHIIFVIIESGMALFAIQLVRTVLYSLDSGSPVPITKSQFRVVYECVIGISEMCTGITPTIILVRVSMRLSFDDKESFKEAVGSLCFNNQNTLQQVGGSSSSMPPQDSERNEDIDICFNNPPSNLDSIVESRTSAQERSEDT